MRRLLSLFFLTAFLSLLVGTDLYLSYHLSNAFGWNEGSLKLLFGILIPFMLFGVFIFAMTQSLVGKMLYWSAGLIEGFMLYLLQITLLLHLISLFVTISPFYFGVLMLGITASITLYGLWNSFWVRVTPLELKVKGLKQDINAVHLSDIHLGHTRSKGFLEKVVKKTNELRPEIVFITGDLFDGRVNLNEAILQPLTQLKMPVYFVEGNHDVYTNVKLIKQHLIDLGIHVLSNQITFYKDLQIIGLNHMRADHETYSSHNMSARRNTIKDTLAALPVRTDAPSVMLHHSPDGIQHASLHNVDILLAGHTHAGQLFPVNYIANFLFPYNKGLHRYENTRIFVSQGIGTFGPPVRVGTKSEIIALKLRGSDVDV